MSPKGGYSGGPTGWVQRKGTVGGSIRRVQREGTGGGGGPLKVSP